METLKDCLLELYLKWQYDTGTRGTITAWAKHLDPDGEILSRANLASLMRGDNTQTSMQVAYLIYEKTGDTCVMDVLGYPVPDAPLVGLEPDERAVVLDWLEKVKHELDKVPDDERMRRLTELVDELPDAVTDTD